MLNNTRSWQGHKFLGLWRKSCKCRPFSSWHSNWVLKMNVLTSVGSLGLRLNMRKNGLNFVVSGWTMLSHQGICPSHFGLYWSFWRGEFWVSGWSVNLGRLPVDGKLMSQYAGSWSGLPTQHLPASKIIILHLGIGINWKWLFTVGIHLSF